MRDAFADRTSSVLAQLLSLHTLQNHLQNTTAGARFSEIAADMSARIGTTERQERDNKEAGASSAAEVTQSRPTAARGFEGAYTLTALSLTALSFVCVFVCGFDVCGFGNVLVIFFTIASGEKIQPWMARSIAHKFV